MIDEIDWNFYNTYPILYPICSTLGIAKEEIDEMVDKIWNNWKLNLKYDKKQTQIILKMIIFRLDKIGETIKDLHYYKNASDEILETVFGIRQIEIVKAIV